MNAQEARRLLKGERVRIVAESPALAGRDGVVLDAVAHNVPLVVKFGANGYRIGRPPFVVVAGGEVANLDTFTAAVAAEFVERA